MEAMIPTEIILASYWVKHFSVEGNEDAAQQELDLLEEKGTQHIYGQSSTNKK